MAFEESRRVAPELHVVESSPSTNADLVRLAADPATPHFTVLATLDQTAGRGRLGRSWTAPSGTALAVSVLLLPRTPHGVLSLERYGWLPIAAGLAMTRTVAAALPAASVGFKWPNDVLVGGRKVCGVLAELVAGRNGVVIGAGVNLTMTADQLPVPTATSLAIEGAEAAALDSDAVLAGYLTQLRTLVEGYVATDGDAESSGLASAARDACITLGRRVRIDLPDGTQLQGTATGLDADGRLVVRDPDSAVHVVAAGDVTHANVIA
jgi:BirA family biotin operon repressor/biotin-[acetyl-CoA-carboxylase] ligase